jgi:hypothetical protein
VFSLMTSFTGSLRTSFTPEQVKMDPQGGGIDLESGGRERSTIEVCHKGR